MGRIYKWYRNGRLIRETLDTEGVVPFRELFSGGVEIQYEYLSRNINDMGWVLNCKTYLKNGERHRDDGPAVIYYHINGQEGYWSHYKNGVYIPTYKG